MLAINLPQSAAFLNSSVSCSGICPMRRASKLLVGSWWKGKWAWRRGSVGRWQRLSRPILTKWTLLSQTRQSMSLTHGCRTTLQVKRTPWPAAALYISVLLSVFLSANCCFLRRCHPCILRPWISHWWDTPDPLECSPLSGPLESSFWPKTQPWKDVSLC